MFFTKPAKSGDVLKFSSKVVYAGNSSVTAYIHVENNGAVKPLVDGFVTFIHVDEHTKPCPHYLHIEATTEEDKILYETAKNLKTK
jgi:acyl-CoA hydrolase